MSLVFITMFFALFAVLVSFVALAVVWNIHKSQD